MTEDLKDQVRRALAAAGSEEAQKLRERSIARAEELGQAFVNETEALQEQAIMAARQAFAEQTQHNATLNETAAYEIAVSGYIAARDAKEGLVDMPRLEAKAHETKDEFAKARRLWQETEDTGQNVIAKARHDWEAYYRDLNATWPVVVRGIDSVNQALSESRVPSQAVRWGEQAARLAADSAQVAEGQIGGIDAQVALAEERAAEALQTTQVNQNKIATLQEMVTRINDS